LKEELRKLHKEIWECRKCDYILGLSKIRPRSGFPAEDSYRAMIVGAEPGLIAEGKPSPEEYKQMFCPGAKNANKARLIFKDIDEAGLDWNQFFFTNSVKCPATKSQAKRCFANCSQFLERQIRSVKPKVLIVMGTAAKHLQLPQAGKDKIRQSIFLGIPTFCIRHPQGARTDYRRRVLDGILVCLKKG